MSENAKLLKILEYLQNEIEDAMHEHAIAENEHEYDHASGRISLADRLIHMIHQLLEE